MSDTLKEIKYIQNIGRFETAKPTGNAVFGPCTLVFGENGWGKSTAADILRSLTANNPDIIKGRKTLAGGPEQKAILRVGTRQAIFEADAWKGPRPRILIYDSVFINENVFSGDIVSTDHLKNQYGMVVGEEGVRRVRRIVELDDENRDINTEIRNTETQLTAVISVVAPQGMTLDAFLALKKQDGIESAITEKDAQVHRARRANELKAAAEPQSFTVPTETEKFRSLLNSEIDKIGEAALRAVRAHIATHAEKKGSMTHESWLEAGTTFAGTDKCPFCGQKLTDRVLVDAYKEFFSGAYKSLATNVKNARDTLNRYKNGDFRKTIKGLIDQNGKHFAYWKEAGKFEAPDLGDTDAAVSGMEKAAGRLDAVFHEKQANLTEAFAGEEAKAALSEWEKGRAEVERINALLDGYNLRIKELKGSIDASDLPRLEQELKILLVGKQRHQADNIQLVEKLDANKKRKEGITKEKTVLRKELDDHGRSITARLGAAINGYLTRLNAGYKIDYKEPDYRGKEPAASYHILINDVPVSLRGDSLAQPSFRNTLSAGDKSTLALALFLAKINADPELKDSIVVLDDPFTSLDGFRRQFTAIEIRKLCGRTAQTIVMSHDKNFLRLLWDKIDHGSISSIALQTGAPGMTTIAPFDIEAATQPRHVTERAEIQEFVEGEWHEPNYIRTRLRTVSEDFYRKGDPALFREAASLDEIIRSLEAAPADHPYKAALEDLKDINEYSRGESHAPIEGNPAEETTDEELKGFCRKVLDLTCGM